MIKILFIFALIPALSFGQIQNSSIDKPKTKVEELSLKTGAFIKKQSVHIGSVKRVGIDAVIINDLESDLILKGIRLEATISKALIITQKSCMLDAEEVESFLKSGNYLLSMDDQAPVDYTEYQFTGRDGFQAGCYSDKRGWSYFIRLDRFDENSVIFLDKGDFKKLIEIIEKAKEKLLNT
jgi:hypothetical protein